MADPSSEWRQVEPVELDAWREAAFIQGVAQRGQSLDLALPPAVPGATAAAVLQKKLSGLRASASCQNFSQLATPESPGPQPGGPAAASPAHTEAGDGGGSSKSSSDALGPQSQGRQGNHTSPSASFAPDAKRHRRLPSLTGLLLCAGRGMSEDGS
jgi:hypothetical protein